MANTLLQDGSISKEEFAYCWNNWIKKIVRPVSAFLVIDVQNDFISGSLAITNCPAKQDGEEVSMTLTCSTFNEEQRPLERNKANLAIKVSQIESLCLDCFNLDHDECVPNKMHLEELLHFRTHDTFLMEL